MQKYDQIIKPERNYGLDLLRILSILAVTVLHLLNLGIKIYNPAPMDFSAAPAILWFLFIAVMFCVNCFGLISGFVGYKSSFSVKKLAGYWLQLFVINAVSTIIYYAVNGWLLKFSDLGDMFFIISKNHYWYMTAYFLVYLCSPLLNKAIQQLSKQLLLGLLAAGLVLFSILPIITGDDTFYVKDGYSFVWLAYLYLAGGYLARFGLPFHARHAALKSFCCYAACVLLLWGSMLKLSPSWLHIMCTYNSPVVLLFSVFFFNFAAALPIRSSWAKKSISFAAPLVLGIYFIQLSPCIWYSVLPNLFGDLTGASFIRTMLKLACYAILIVFGCGAAEYLRILLFRKINIQGVCESLGNCCQALICRLCGKAKEMKKALAGTRNLSHAVFCVGFMFVLVFCIWKLPYGFGGNDESLYVSLPSRILSGAKLFADEWNLGQFYAIELIPFVWVYRLIFGSSDGIILGMRWAYLFLHAACTIGVYGRLRKVNGWGAAIASLLMLIFTPYDIMGLSYNNIALDTLILCGAYISTDYKAKPLPLIFLGALFALSVLGAPFLTLVFILFGVYALFCKLKNTSNLVPRQFVFFTAGIVICAVIFLAIMVLNTGVSNIFEYITYVLNDPQHSEVSSFERVLTSVFERTPQHTDLLYAAYATLLIIMLLDKKRSEHHFIYMPLTVLIMGGCVLLLLPYLPVYYYNHIYPPLAMVGITACVLLRKKPVPVILFMLIPGLLYGVCIQIGSNQGAYAISMALFAAAIPGIVFCSMLIKELCEQTATGTKKPAAAFLRFISCAAIICYLFCTFALSVYIKKNHTFQDASPAFINSTFSDGPAKGIASSKDPGTTINADYTAVYNDMRYLCQQEPGKVLILDNRTWGYLIADKHECASYSSWMTDWGDFDRLKLYYELRPENKPDYVYFTKASGLTLKQALKLLGGEWDVHETDIGYTLTAK